MRGPAACPGRTRGGGQPAGRQQVDGQRQRAGAGAEQRAGERAGTAQPHGHGISAPASASMTSATVPLVDKFGSAKAAGARSGAGQGGGRDGEAEGGAGLLLAGVRRMMTLACHSPLS